MDQKLLFLINRDWTSPWADRGFALASCWDAWLLPLICIAAALWLFGGFRARAFIIVASLIVAVEDGAISNTLKHLIDRPRPTQLLSDIRVVDLAKGQPRLLQAFRPLRVKMSRPDPQDQAGRSFPSSHTMNTFSAAVSAVFFFGRRCWWAFLLAAIVAYSRIYTGSHWPSDVLTSILLSLGSSLLLLVACETLWRRRGNALLPRLHAQYPCLSAT